MIVVKRRSKNWNNKYVYVQANQKDRHPYYSMCEGCLNKNVCMKLSILESLQMEIGVLSIVWECPSFLPGAFAKKGK